MHKFGIRLPHTVQEALAIDAEEKSDVWWKAIQKEMAKIDVAFEFCDNWTPEQVCNNMARGDFVGYQEI